VFKTPGWLARHIKSNHSGVAVPEHPITPPAVRLTAVGPAQPLPNPGQASGARRRAAAGEHRLLVVGAGGTLRVAHGDVHRGTPDDLVPVLMPGDGHGGLSGYGRRRHPRGDGDGGA
jgi:hypothetical protein